MRAASMEIFGEHHACSRILLSVPGETGVGHQPDDVVAIAVHKGRGLLVITGEEHFGTSSHAQHRLMLVESLGSEIHRLFQQKLE